jgi:hypothetical protein
MPKLSRGDWEMMRNQYHVAFTTWPDDAFNDLMDTIYGPPTGVKNNPAADDTDALLIGQVHAEPPIQPAARESATSTAEPPIQPADEDPHT